MQIHEITRKPVAEGILKGVANTVQKAGKAVARSGAVSALKTAGRAASAAGGMLAQNVLGQVQSATGIDVSPGGPGAASASQRRDLGAKLTQPLVAPIAQKLAQDWNKTLTNFVKQYGPPGGPNWPAAGVAEDLDNIINQYLLRGRIQWKDLAERYQGDPANELSAQKIETKIKLRRDRIANALPTQTKNGDWQLPPAYNAVWKSLVEAAFDAVNLITQDPSQRYRVGSTAVQGVNITVDPATNTVLYDGKPFDPGNPRHVLAKRALGIP